MKIKPITENEINIETKRGFNLSIFDTENYSAITIMTHTKLRKIEIDVTGNIWEFRFAGYSIRTPKQRISNLQIVQQLSCKQCEKRWFVNLIIASVTLAAG